MQTSIGLTWLNHKLQVAHEESFFYNNRPGWAFPQAQPKVAAYSTEPDTDDLPHAVLRPIKSQRALESSQCTRPIDLDLQHSKHHLP